MKKKSLLLTVVAMLGLTAATMAQNVPSYVPTNGLVGWWPFNGNANDESGNGNNGAVNGAILTQDRFGNTNKAYIFDGIDDFILVSNTNNVLDLTNSLTISSWFYANNTSAFNGIISKASCNNANIKGYVYGLQDFVSNGLNPKVHLQAYPYMSNANPCLPSNSGIISLGSWYNFVTSYDNSNSKLKYYLNGSLIDSINISFDVDTTNLNTYFGTHLNQNNGNCGNATFNGLLDDIGIWNRALTNQEIADLFNGNICYQTITVTDTLLINMGITGFNPVTYNNTIKIFPNPSNDHITIDYGNFASLNGYQLKIENSIGQQVFQTNVTQQSDYLSLTNWGGNGLYFVRIIDPQGNTIDIRKIVLQ